MNNIAPVYGTIKQEVATAQFYAATTDMWSSRTWTAYYWGLDEAKMSTISTDNAASIINACRDGGWNRISCFGHRLNLAVVNALKKGDKAIDKAISSCQKVATHFAHSHKKSRLLEAAQEELYLPKYHLLNECPTGWGSKFTMMNNFLEQECAVGKVLSADKNTHLIPTGEDLATLEAIRSAIKHVASFTDTLLGEDPVKKSLVQPTVMLFNKLLVPEEGCVALTRQIKSSILKCISKHHQRSTDDWQLVSKCSFLDPRFKPTHNESVTEIILRECEQLASDVRGTITLESATISCTASAKCKSWEAYLNALTTPALTTASSDRLSKEVSLYTSLPTVAKKDSDSLTWWSQH
ncbi:zinc finger BED domain-containing protein 4-like [Watersipora subatra]|uniref:zinc finger BED domain-containing protein 4-like n=1 Tax=Watersipora subatra TaxID=2589382 RepID=UPI00355B25CD